MQNVQDMMVEQAGFGLAIGVSVHEIAKITSNFFNGITNALKSDIPDREKLEDLKKASSSLKTELKRFGPFRAIRNEAPAEFKISKSLKFCYSVFKREFNKLNIDFSYDRTDLDTFDSCFLVSAGKDRTGLGYQLEPINNLEGMYRLRKLVFRKI